MGWWIIFPIIFMAFMLIMMFRMMGRGGPMGMMGGMGGMGGGHRRGADDESHSSHGAQDDRADSQETPLEIAQRRYASGELSREEFQSIRDDLE